MKKHVFKPRRVGFDDQVVRHIIMMLVVLFLLMRAGILVCLPVLI